VVRNSDGNDTSETRHPFTPLGFFGEEVPRRELVLKVTLIASSGYARIKHASVWLNFCCGKD
jgi:hypothetical protein